MPDDAAGEDDYRVVVGEECFDWRQLPDSGLAEALDTLAELLEPLADGHRAAFLDAAYDTECRPSVTLLDALYTPDAGLPTDERRLLQQLLQKCRIVSPGEADLPCPVRRADAPDSDWRESSWGMAHALARAAAGRATSCLWPSYASAAQDWPSGWITVARRTEAGEDAVRLHLLRLPGETPGFWRAIFTAESVPAERFFDLTPDAFPDLLFAESLRLNHFKGAYVDVLPWLVALLGALNDQFTQALSACAGDQKQVIARFAAMGLDISPESPNTKRNAKAWEQRNVAYEDGVEYRCEWHGKRLWDRDRVHFSLPIPAQGNRVLIGIFADHLDT
ncbi:hypothetical protein AB0D74_04500 [Streptomyces sp. NPDC048278]|uniref:hypothetical protein n=1 Tax=Streptomyces sp. NPDC048278 TaxID=3155809 RepID=UPI0034417B30